MAPKRTDVPLSAAGTLKTHPEQAMEGLFGHYYENRGINLQFRVEAYIGDGQWLCQMYSFADGGETCLQIFNNSDFYHCAFYCTNEEMLNAYEIGRVVSPISEK